MFCPKCRNEVAPGSSYCPNCGQSLKSPSADNAFLESFSVSPVILNCGTIGIVISALFLFFAWSSYSNLPFYASSSDVLFAQVLLFAAVLCLAECAVTFFQSKKVSLRICENTISGHWLKTLFYFQIAETFEIRYEDIEEVRIRFGGLQIRTHGRWQGIPVVNAQKALDLIEKRRIPHS